MTDDKDKATELVESVFGKPGSSPIYQTAGRLIAGLVEHVTDALTAARKEAREAAFTEIGVELRRYGPNIRKVDLMTRFQELFRESGATANTEEGAGDG